MEIWVLALPYNMGRYGASVGYDVTIIFHQFKIQFSVVLLFPNCLELSIHIRFRSTIFHSSMPSWIIFANWTGSMFFMRSTLFSAAQWESSVFFVPRNNYNTETRIKEFTGLHRLVVSPETLWATLLPCQNSSLELLSKKISKVDKNSNLQILDDLTFTK